MTEKVVALVRTAAVRSVSVAGAHVLAVLSRALATDASAAVDAHVAKAVFAKAAHGREQWE